MLRMMQTVTVFSIGFSVISAVVLFTAYAVFFKNVNKSWAAILSCALLLISVSVLQVYHYDYFHRGTDLLSLRGYRFWLSLAPPMFYFFSRAVLLPGQKLHPVMMIHLCLLLVNLIPKYEVAISIIFVAGTAYSFWFANLIYTLRTQRKRFRIEIFFYSLFSLLAVGVLALGLSAPYMDHHVFYLFYSNGIALPFILIVGSLIVFPDVLNELAAVATLSYARSTLHEVDIESSLTKLNDLMIDQRLYQNENLNLSMAAAAVDLSPHQLSELINVHYGVNFSRFIREQRIEAAKELLLTSPDASILAISLETGFRSQSNFYAAFKEITGQSPGDYRKTASSVS